MKGFRELEKKVDGYRSVHSHRHMDGSHPTYKSYLERIALDEGVRRMWKLKEHPRFKELVSDDVFLNTVEGKDITKENLDNLEKELIKMNDPEYKPIPRKRMFENRESDKSAFSATSTKGSMSPSNSANNIIPQKRKHLKSSDTMSVGVMSGIEQDEQGNYRFNPYKALIGVGGYSVAKKIVMNKQAQTATLQALKSAIESVEKKAQTGNIYAQTILGKNYIFTHPHTPKGEYMDGAFSDRALKQTMGEIDDSNVKSISKGDLETLAKSDPYGITELPLYRVLKHDELFKKYPKLKDTKVVYMSAKGEDELYHGAHFNPTENMIVVGNGLKGNEIKSALLHEIQHWIQNKEGWARGGRMDEFELPTSEALYKKTIEDYEVKRKPKVDELLQMLKDRRIDGKEFDKRYKALEETKSIQELNQQIYNAKYPRQAYQRLHGEQMARATQARMKMTPVQRMAESFQDTLKRVEGEYNEPIIKHGDSVAKSEVLKRDLMKNGVIRNDLSKHIAPDLPKGIYNRDEFVRIVGNDRSFKIKTPIEEFNVNVKHAWDHIDGKNKNREKRYKIAGAFLDTLKKPLFIVRNGEQIEYYKLYSFDDKTIGLTSITKTKNGKLHLKTFFEKYKSTLENVISNTKEENVLYYELAGETRQSLEATNAGLIGRVPDAPYSTHRSDSILSNSGEKVKPNRQGARGGFLNIDKEILGGSLAGAGLGMNKDLTNDDKVDEKDMLIGMLIGAFGAGGAKSIWKKTFKDDSSVKKLIQKTNDKIIEPVLTSDLFQDIYTYNLNRSKPYMDEREILNASMNSKNSNYLLLHNQLKQLDASTRQDLHRFLKCRIYRGSIVK